MTEAHAAIWRFRPAKQIDAPSFSCDWAEDASWSDWDAGSGELLESIEWSDGRTTLHIGTGDAEFYARLVGRVPWLPARWLDAVFKGDRWEGWEHFPFDYEPEQKAGAPTRAHIVLPPVFAKEICQVHFLIAWVDPSDPGDVSSWLAVEQDPAVFLPAEIDSIVG